MCSWQSPKDAGLYCSLVLRPQLEISAWPLITLMAALAVSDALIKACNLRADIKWPNDLCINERKLCGILAETVEARDGLLSSGMEGGMTEGYEKLDELLKKL